MFDDWRKPDLFVRPLHAPQKGVYARRSGLSVAAEQIPRHKAGGMVLSVFGRPKPIDAFNNVLAAQIGVATVQALALDDE